MSRSNEGVSIQTRPLDGEVGNRNGAHIDSMSRTESFDELVLCVLADDPLRILEKTATWREKFVLGGAKFFDDITITHSDSVYVQKRHETKFGWSLCATPGSSAQENQIAFSKGEQVPAGS